MTFVNERIATAPSTFAEQRRKFLLRLKASHTEPYDPSVPQYLVDSFRNRIVFGEDRILVRPVVVPEP